MRLFHRRKGIEFDDPRLVGMTSLKPPEDHDHQGMMPTVKEEGVETDPDKCKMTNGSSWRRIQRPWDSMKRLDSSEHVSRSVISNRRKTLHFYGERDEEGRENCQGHGHRINLGSTKSDNQPPLQIRKEITPTSQIPQIQPKRKLGRVESLRLLLSKSNRIYKGRNSNIKQDKGTDTQDLNKDSMEQFQRARFAETESQSKYSSISSLRSESVFYPISSFHQQFKATSCENLSNQGRTLPGYRDCSTSTTTMGMASYLDSTSPPSKKSSFPYAYIRSRLTSLQEEPKRSPVKPPRNSISIQNKGTSNSSFIPKGFYHSMGNLLSSGPKEEDEDEEGHHQSSTVDEEEEEVRVFDPLKQIRIDLLHRNPSEIDEGQSPSPTSFWGKRSYSIGDILMMENKQKVVLGKSNSNGIEESGYDSDSTRNGHESPQNSGREQSPINKASINEKTGETESLDSQPPSGSEISSRSSYSSSPTTGCLITISSSPPPQRTPSVNGFRKEEDGSIIEVRTEIDQSEDIDVTLPSSKRGQLTSKIPVIVTKSRSHVTLVQSKEEEEGNGLTLSINKKETIESQQKTAPSLRLRNRVRDREREWNAPKPSRSKSLCLSIFTITFNKGEKRKSLGFSVIGGKDSPVPGIFVKRVFPFGQAAEDGNLTEGDEILSVNGQPLANSTHAEALHIFKSIKTGDIVMEVARREFFAPGGPVSVVSSNLKRQYSQIGSKSCEQLHQAY